MALRFENFSFVIINQRKQVAHYAYKKIVTQRMGVVPPTLSNWNSKNKRNTKESRDERSWNKYAGVKNMFPKA